MTFNKDMTLDPLEEIYNESYWIYFCLYNKSIPSLHNFSQRPKQRNYIRIVDEDTDLNCTIEISFMAFNNDISHHLKF